jgi:hypothetical protein
MIFSYLIKDIIYWNQGNISKVTIRWMLILEACSCLGLKRYLLYHPCFITTLLAILNISCFLHIFPVVFTQVLYIKIKYTLKIPGFIVIISDFLNQDSISSRLNQHVYIFHRLYSIILLNNFKPFCCH